MLYSSGWLISLSFLPDVGRFTSSFIAFFTTGAFCTASVYFLPGAAIAGPFREPAVAGRASESCAF